MAPKRPAGGSTPGRARRSSDSIPIQTILPDHQRYRRDTAHSTPCSPSALGVSVGIGQSGDVTIKLKPSKRAIESAALKYNCSTSVRRHSLHNSCSGRTFLVCINLSRCLPIPALGRGIRLAVVTGRVIALMCHAQVAIGVHMLANPRQPEDDGALGDASRSSFDKMDRGRRFSASGLHAYAVQ